MPVNHAKDFWNPFKMRPYFHNCLPNLWAAICEWWSISQKTFLVKNHFKWLDLQVVWCGKKSDNLRATLVHIIKMEISFRYLAYIICRKKTLRAMVIKLERFSKAKCTPALLAEHKIMIQIISKNWLNNFCQNYCMCLIKPVL